MREWEEGDRARASEVRRQLESRRRQMLPSCALKELSPSPATSTDGVVVFPPLQLRWRPILRAFLPLLRREPRTRVQGLTPPLFPRNPQLSPLAYPVAQSTSRPSPLTGLEPISFSGAFPAQGAPATGAGNHPAAVS